MFKVKPPALSVGDVLGDLIVLEYLGHYRPPECTRRQIHHHYRLQCKCGEVIVRIQTRLVEKDRPQRRCPKCAILRRALSNRKYNAKKRAKVKPSLTVREMEKLWPVPGRI